MNESTDTLHLFHVHDGEGNHGDDETYSIVYACDEHVEKCESHPEAEYINHFQASDGEKCDFCGVDS